MTARDDILAQLHTAAREETHPSAWESRRQFDDLAAVFTQALTDAHGEVVRAESFHDAAAQLGTLLVQIDAKRIVTNGTPPLSALNLPARWPNFAWHTVGQTAGNLRTFCQTADVGLSGTSAALAATGSVAIQSGPAQSRAATLLPPVHIALVPTSCLLPDIFAWARLARTMPANVTLVSGPSKTADIEQTLAVGVHGPKRFIAVLYPG